MENQNNNGIHNNYMPGSGLEDAELKFGKMYHVIDALIDTVNAPQNRKNAIKFGIRAIGELLSEFPHAHDDHGKEAELENNHESKKMAENGLGQVKSDPNAPAYDSKL